MISKEGFVLTSRKGWFGWLVYPNLQKGPGEEGEERRTPKPVTRTERETFAMRLCSA